MPRAPGHRSSLRVLLTCWFAAAGLASAAGEPIEDEAFDGPVHIDDAALPRPSFTPGDVLPKIKIKDLCGADAAPAPHEPSTALCDTAFARYGIAAERRYQYVCRYLVPPSIGGASTARNVWPQVVSEAKLKDALDHDVTTRVCASEVSLNAAQAEIQADWVSAYRKYLIPGDPAPVVLAPTPPANRAVREGAGSTPSVVGSSQFAADALGGGGAGDASGSPSAQGGYPDMPMMPPQQSSPQQGSPQQSNPRNGQQTNRPSRKQDPRADRRGSNAASQANLGHLPRNAPMRPVTNVRPAISRPSARSGFAAPRMGAARQLRHRGGPILR